MAAADKQTRKGASSVDNGQDGKRVANKLAQRRFRRQHKDHVANLEKELALCRAGASAELVQRRLDVEKLKVQTTELRALLLHVTTSLRQICGDDDPQEPPQKARSDSEPRSPQQDPTKEPKEPISDQSTQEGRENGGELLRQEEHSNSPVHHYTTSESPPVANEARGHDAVPEAQRTANLESRCHGDKLPSHFEPRDSCWSLEPTISLQMESELQSAGQNTCLPMYEQEVESEPEQGGMLHISLLDEHTPLVKSLLEGVTLINSAAQTQGEQPQDILLEDFSRVLQEMPAFFSELSPSLSDMPMTGILSSSPRNVHADASFPSSLDLHYGKQDRKSRPEKSSLLWAVNERLIEEFLDEYTPKLQFLSLEEISRDISQAVLSIVENCMRSWLSLQENASITMFGGSSWIIWQIVKHNYVLPRLAQCGFMTSKLPQNCAFDVFRDTMPAWLRPTKVQQTTQYNRCIDFVPWPEVRNQLILNQDKISFDEFFSNINERWVPTGAEEDMCFSVDKDEPPDIRHQFTSIRERRFKDNFYNQIGIWKVRPNTSPEASASECLVLVDKLIRSHITKRDYH